MRLKHHPDLPRLTREEVEVLFVWDYYGGPLSGALQWRGRRFWFAAVLSDSWPADQPEVFRVHDLADEQWRRIDDLNDLFQKHVTSSNESRDPSLYYDDPRVQAWQDPAGEMVATLRLYGEAPAVPEL